jgi:hypothetical protein
MAQFITLADQILNIDNVVAIDMDGTNILRVWFVGSSTPLQLQNSVPSARVLQFLKDRGLLLV